MLNDSKALWRGVRFEIYYEGGLKTGPLIEWFKDLAGNSLSVLEEG